MGAAFNWAPSAALSPAGSRVRPSTIFRPARYIELIALAEQNRLAIFEGGGQVRDSVPLHSHSKFPSWHRSTVLGSVLMIAL